MHDSHEEPYRYLRPQACIDELRSLLAKTMQAAQVLDAMSGNKSNLLFHLCEQARATIEKTKPWPSR